jgi:small basic protein (TIGR04137 family)
VVLSQEHCCCAIIGQKDILCAIHDIRRRFGNGPHKQTSRKKKSIASTAEAASAENRSVKGQSAARLQAAAQCPCRRHGSSFFYSKNKIRIKVRQMSRHPSFGKANKTTKKRNVLKRFERVDVLKKLGRWKETDTRVTGLPKTPVLP